MSFTKILLLACLIIGSIPLLATTGVLAEEPEEVEIRASVENASISTEEELVVEGTIQYSGDENETVDVALELNGITVSTTELELNPSATTEFRLNESGISDGVYDVSVRVSGDFGTDSQDIRTVIVGEPEVKDLEIPFLDRIEEGYEEPIAIIATFKDNQSMALPADLVDLEVTNESVLILYQDFSYIVASEPGTATLIAGLGSERAYHEIEVYATPYEITLGNNSIPPGVTTNITISHIDDGYTRSSYIWVKDHDIATLSGPLEVKALEPGTTQVLATPHRVSISTELVVYSSPTALALDVSNEVLEVGDEGRYDVTATFEDGNSFTVTDPASVATSDPGIASVENRSLIAHEPGETQLEAEYLGETVKVTITVTGSDETDETPIQFELLIVGLALLIALVVAIHIQR